MGFTFRDGLTSLVTGMGLIGATKRGSTTFAANVIGANELRAAYQSSWMAEKVVDIPVEDALRKKRAWQALTEQVAALEAEENRLGLFAKAMQAGKLARQDGYAAIYIAVGDEDPMEPLDPERIGEGDLRSLAVLTMTQCRAGELEDDIEDPRFGMPRYWSLGTGRVAVDVHPSRLALFTGKPTLDPFSPTTAGASIGTSALEAPWQAIKDAESTIGNVASLVFEANVDIYKIPGFMAKIGDSSYEERILNRLTLANLSKGTAKALVLDAEEEFDRKAVSFSSLPDILREMMQIVAGAADIPLTRFLGTSPAGLSTTGDGDMDTYYDRVQSMQELDIRPALAVLDECLIRSALGSRPEEVFYTWPPLRQMNDKTRADVAKVASGVLKDLIDTGTFTQDEMRGVVANEFGAIGFFGGLEAKVAEDAERSEIGAGEPEGEGGDE